MVIHAMNKIERESVKKPNPGKKWKNLEGKRAMGKKVRKED